LIQRPNRAKPQPQRVNIQYSAGIAIRINTVLLPSPPMELSARFSQMSLPADASF